MSGYPRYSNGYVDRGEPIKSSRKNCPNCGSSKYIETISREHCSACGLTCDYWGGGANSVYENMMSSRAAAEAYESRKKLDEEIEQACQDLRNNE